MKQIFSAEFYPDNHSQASPGRFICQSGSKGETSSGSADKVRFNEVLDQAGVELNDLSRKVFRDKEREFRDVKKLFKAEKKAKKGEKIDEKNPDSVTEVHLNKAGEEVNKGGGADKAYKVVDKMKNITTYFVPKRDNSGGLELVVTVKNGITTELRENGKFEITSNDNGANFRGKNGELSGAEFKNMANETVKAKLKDGTVKKVKGSAKKHMTRERAEVQMVKNLEQATIASADPDKLKIECPPEGCSKEQTEAVNDAFFNEINNRLKIEPIGRILSTKRSEELRKQKITKNRRCPYGAGRFTNERLALSETEMTGVIDPTMDRNELANTCRSYCENEHVQKIFTESIYSAIKNSAEKGKDFTMDSVTDAICQNEKLSAEVRAGMEAYFATPVAAPVIDDLNEKTKECVGKLKVSVRDLTTELGVQMQAKVLDLSTPAKQKAACDQLLATVCDDQQIRATVRAMLDCDGGLVACVNNMFGAAEVRDFCRKPEAEVWNLSIFRAKVLDQHEAVFGGNDWLNDVLAKDDNFKSLNLALQKRIDAFNSQNLEDIKDTAEFGWEELETKLRKEFNSVLLDDAQVNQNFRGKTMKPVLDAIFDGQTTGSSLVEFRGKGKKIREKIMAVEFAAKQIAIEQAAFGGKEAYKKAIDEFASKKFPKKKDMDLWSAIVVSDVSLEKVEKIAGEDLLFSRFSPIGRILDKKFRGKSIVILDQKPVEFANEEVKNKYGESTKWLDDIEEKYAAKVTDIAGDGVVDPEVLKTNFAGKTEVYQETLDGLDDAMTALVDDFDPMTFSVDKANDEIAAEIDTQFASAYVTNLLEGNIPSNRINEKDKLTAKVLQIGETIQALKNEKARFSGLPVSYNDVVSALGETAADEKNRKTAFVANLETITGGKYSENEKNAIWEAVDLKNSAEKSSSGIPTQLQEFAAKAMKFDPEVSDEGIEDDFKAKTETFNEESPEDRKVEFNKYTYTNPETKKSTVFRKGETMTIPGDTPATLTIGDVKKVQLVGKSDDYIQFVDLYDTDKVFLVPEIGLGNIDITTGDGGEIEYLIPPEGTNIIFDFDEGGGDEYEVVEVATEKLFGLRETPPGKKDVSYEYDWKTERKTKKETILVPLEGQITKTITEYEKVDKDIPYSWTWEQVKTPDTPGKTVQISDCADVKGLGNLLQRDFPDEIRGKNMYSMPIEFPDKGKFYTSTNLNRWNTWQKKEIPSGVPCANKAPGDKNFQQIANPTTVGEVHMIPKDYHVTVDGGKVIITKNIPGKVTPGTVTEKITWYRDGKLVGSSADPKTYVPAGVPNSFINQARIKISAGKAIGNPLSDNYKQTVQVDAPKQKTVIETVPLGIKSPILFDTEDEDTIDVARDKPLLDVYAKAINDMVARNTDPNKVYEVEIHGFCSFTEEDDYNVSLSQRRIKAVRDYLEPKLRGNIKIKEEPHGEKYVNDKFNKLMGGEIADGKNPKAKNRRTVILLKEVKDVPTGEETITWNFSKNGVKLDDKKEFSTKAAFKAHAERRFDDEVKKLMDTKGKSVPSFTADSETEPEVKGEIETTEATFSLAGLTKPEKIRGKTLAVTVAVEKTMSQPKKDKIAAQIIQALKDKGAINADVTFVDPSPELPKDSVRIREVESPNDFLFKSKVERKTVKGPWKKADGNPTNSVTKSKNSLDLSGGNKAEKKKQKEYNDTERVLFAYDDLGLDFVDREDLEDLYKMSPRKLRDFLATDEDTFGWFDESYRAVAGKIGMVDASSLIEWLEDTDGKEFLKSGAKNLKEWIDAKYKKENPEVDEDEDDSDDPKPEDLDTPLNRIKLPSVEKLREVLGKEFEKHLKDVKLKFTDLTEDDWKDLTEILNVELRKNPRILGVDGDPIGLKKLLEAAKSGITSFFNEKNEKVKDEIVESVGTFFEVLTGGDLLQELDKISEDDVDAQSKIIKKFTSQGINEKQLALVKRFLVHHNDGSDVAKEAYDTVMSRFDDPEKRRHYNQLFEGMKDYFSLTQ